jgi:trehalose 6-phosphate phosphatase
MSSATSVLDDLGATLAAGGRLLFLSDFDGTLAPLAPEPGQVELPAATRDNLRALARSPRARVGILSGRALDDIRRRVGLPELIYGGCHGLEVDGPGVAFRHPEAERHRARLAELVDELRGRLAELPGVRVESKGLAVALHYRNAPPGTAERLSRVAAQSLRRSPDLTLLRGKKVIEILPAVGWDKGECARWIRERVFGAATGDVATLYLGDDETDEHAFAALASSSITVRVGAHAVRSHAAHRVRGVADVARLVGALARQAGEAA